MRARPLFCLAAVLAAATAVASAETPRVVSKILPGTSIVVVAAEGDLESRSVGSYSIRAYAGTNARFPYDTFIAGAIRPRDGAIDDVLFADLDRDGAPEIVVVIRSVGTGSYLSADAFRLQGRVLSLVESVSGLSKDADPIGALETKVAGGAHPRAVPEVEKRGGDHGR